MPTFFQNLVGYDILAMIGEGGMGQVFLARQKSLNRRVAIKSLRFEPESSTDERLARFEREARVLSSVDHPNIITVFDCGVSEGYPYLVMEYFEGRSLRDFLEVDKPLPVDRVRSVLHPLSLALTYLHERGIVHRDLKPENVLLDNQGRIKICDFGIASELREIGSATKSGEIVGTIDYMAPEQRYRLEVDGLSDQFSLSVIAYEMLTGRKPLGAFKPPSKHNPKLSPEVDTVIMRGLQESPEDRYATIGEFWIELERSLRSIGVRRKRRLVGVVASTAVLLATIGVLLAHVAADRDHKERSQEPGAAPESPGFVESREQHEPERTTETPKSTATAEKLRLLTVEELRDKAKELGYTGYSKLRKAELIELLVRGPQSITLPPGWTTEITEDRIGRRYRWFVAPDGRRFRSLPEWATASNDTANPDQATTPNSRP